MAGRKRRRRQVQPVARRDHALVVDTGPGLPRRPRRPVRLIDDREVHRSQLLPVGTLERLRQDNLGSRTS